MMYGLYNDYYGWGAGSSIGWFGSAIMMVVMMALMIALIVWVVRALDGKHPHASSHALSILKERYAKGEIDKEEFESKKKDLAA